MSNKENFVNGYKDGKSGNKESTNFPKFTLEIEYEGKKLSRTELEKKNWLNTDSHQKTKVAAENWLREEITKIGVEGQNKLGDQAKIWESEINWFADVKKRTQSNLYKKSDNYRTTRKNFFNYIDRVLTEIYIYKVLNDIEELRTETNLENILNCSQKEAENYDEILARVLNIHLRREGRLISYKELIESELAKLRTEKERQIHSQNNINPDTRMKKETKTKKSMSGGEFSFWILLIVIVLLILGVIFYFTTRKRKKDHS